MEAAAPVPVLLELMVQTLHKKLVPKNIKAFLLLFSTKGRPVRMPVRTLLDDLP